MAHIVYPSRRLPRTYPCECAAAQRFAFETPEIQGLLLRGGTLTSRTLLVVWLQPLLGLDVDVLERAMPTSIATATPPFPLGEDHEINIFQGGGAKNTRKISPVEESGEDQVARLRVSVMLEAGVYSLLVKLLDVVTHLLSPRNPVVSRTATNLGTEIRGIERRSYYITSPPICPL
jgi:hypothetical protein